MGDCRPWSGFQGSWKFGARLAPADLLFPFGPQPRILCPQFGEMAEWSKALPC